MAECRLAFLQSLLLFQRSDLTDRHELAEVARKVLAAALEKGVEIEVRILLNRDDGRDKENAPSIWVPIWRILRR